MAFDFEEIKDLAKEKPWLVYGGVAVAGVLGFLALRNKTKTETIFVPAEATTGGSVGGGFESGGDMSQIGYGMDQLAAFTQRQSEITLAAIDTMQRQYHEDLDRLRADMDADRAAVTSQVAGLAATQRAEFNMLNQGLEDALSKEPAQLPSYYIEPPAAKTPAPTYTPPPVYKPEPVYIPEPVYSVPSSLIYEGMSGSEVRGLQEQLTGLGYDLGSVDGIFGPKTAAALRKFQTDAGIGVDAIAGQETFGALQKATAPQATQPVYGPPGPPSNYTPKVTSKTPDPDYSYGGLPRTSQVRE